MIPRSVKAPTIPIPFHKLLKVVAVVDRNNAQTAALLDLIRAEGYEPYRSDITVADGKTLTERATLKKIK